MSLVRALLFVPLSALSLLAQDSVRGVRIGTEYSSGGRPGLAVLPVAGTNGDSIRTMLQRDFDFGDRVVIVGQNAEDLPLVDGVPNASAYGIFTRIGAMLVAQASFTSTGELHVALYRTADKAVVQAANFALTGAPLSADWRMSVHRASDEVERWATGVAGISATRIAFTRGNQVWQVDSDGANATPIEGTAGGRSPAWDPTGRYIAYSTGPGADAGGVFVRDLVSGTTRRVTRSVRSGSYGAPMFLPDGSMLAYSFGIDGTDIFVVDHAKGTGERNLTAGRSVVNTSPTFSRDGRQMAFASSRMGPPDVYIADIDGSNVRVLTDEGFGDKTYRTNPSWSPDGRMIAYQSMVNGQFQVVQTTPTGRNTQSLTSEGGNEDPFWAADSRHIVFASTRSGSSQLWVLDTQSGRSRQLTRGGGVKHGAWSLPLARR
jgi:TolB protein